MTSYNIDGVVYWWEWTVTSWYIYGERWRDMIYWLWRLMSHRILMVNCDVTWYIDGEHWRHTMYWRWLRFSVALFVTGKRLSYWRRLCTDGGVHLTSHHALTLQAQVSLVFQYNIIVLNTYIMATQLGRALRDSFYVAHWCARFNWHQFTCLTHSRWCIILGMALSWIIFM